MFSLTSRRVIGVLLVPVFCLVLVLSLFGFAHARAENSLPPARHAATHVDRAALHIDMYLQARAQIRETAWLRQQRRLEALRQLHQDYWLHAVGAQLYTAWNSPITLQAINWY